jgi:hypothetical protein
MSQPIPSANLNIRVFTQSGPEADINFGSFRAPRCTSVNPASVSGSPTEEVEEAAAFLACEAQGLGEPVMTPYEPPES